MSPADSFVWAVVAASATWLFLSTLVPASLQGLVAVGQRLHPLSRPIATVVAAVLLIGLVRSSPGAAVVPPPSERVIVDRQAETTAVAISNPGPRPVTGSGAGSIYTIVRGDTLWGIARQILGQRGGTPTGAEISAAWQMIYATNADVVGDDPNLILPGQVLSIPGGVHG